LITDNKPLTQILYPDKGLPALSTSRMLHYALILAGFDYSVQHRSSEKNGNADFCSRFPRPAPVSLAAEPEDDIHNIRHLDVLDTLPIT